MGVSAVGDRGIRPRTIPLLFFGALAVLAVLVYLFGPPVMPGMRSAAEDKCNQMYGANFRSYRLEWVLPKSPNWDPPTGCARTSATSPSPAPTSAGG